MWKNLRDRLRLKLRHDDGSFLTGLFCALLAIVGVWHALDFSHDFDTEFPGLKRDHYSRYAPFAYRLAEPGDTLDLTTLYLSTVGLGLLALVAFLNRHKSITAQEKSLLRILLGLCMAGFWIGSAPDPTPDGWHGLAWQAIFRVSTPVWIRVILASIAIGLSGIMFLPFIAQGRSLYRNSSRGWRLLSFTCGFFVLWRIAGTPDPEPWGYWQRWGMVVSMSIVVAALIGQLKEIFAASPEAGPKHLRRLGIGAISLIFVLIQAGYYIHWLHWPIPRFKVVIPGQLYVSAMPPPAGLALANERHHFKTIVNLFNEDTPLRHPNFPKELAYAQSHGIRYVRAEGKSYGAVFVQSTLDEVRKPENWPVLVHCHGNMDRTPAWLGLYRFIDQGWSMTEILAAIERHRGYRPKGGTTMLYNDVLPVLAPDRWKSDPAARRMAANAFDYLREHEPEKLAGKEIPATSR